MMVDVRRSMKKLTPWDVAYAVDMTIACGISYAIITQLLVHFVDKPSDLLGGMWAVVSTVFVFREKRAISLTAGLDRLLATCVSFALCLVYLLVFPFTPLGLAAVIGIGTVVMMLLGREDDIVTTGITTAVVLVVAALSPDEAWQQPILRLIDTVVGIGVGLSCKWIASFAFFWVVGHLSAGRINAGGRGHAK
jgi:uncharacterized membrane protein YgaE (UPF0421/DUF939 family)